MGKKVASGIKHLSLSLQITPDQEKTNLEAKVRATQMSFFAFQFKQIGFSDIFSLINQVYS